MTLPSVPALPTTALAALLAVLLAAVAGALTGAGVRAGLARMRRGVVVRRGPCEVALAVAGSTIAGAAAAGSLPARWVPAMAGLAVLAVAGSATDLLAARLPDRLTLPAVPVGLALVVPLGRAAVLGALAGGALLGAAHAAVHLAVPAALGAGDVKLAPSLGVVLGAAPTRLLPTLVAMPVLAAALLLLLALVRRRRALPFAPVMFAATGLELAVIL